MRYWKQQKIESDHVLSKNRQHLLSSNNDSRNFPEPSHSFLNVYWRCFLTTEMELDIYSVLKDDSS